MSPSTKAKPIRPKATLYVTSQRNFNITGYVHTSHGKITTSVSEQQNFSGTQTIDFDTVNATVLDQKTDVHNSVYSATTVLGDGGKTVITDNFSFPITVDFIYPVSTATFGLTVTTSQNYQASKEVSSEGKVVYADAVTNSVNATDLSPASSSQTYTSFDSDGMFYNCYIASKNNILTSVSRGCNQDQY